MPPMQRNRWPLGAVLAIALTLGRHASAEPRVVDRIVAVVDHQPVLLSDALVQAAPDLAQARRDQGEAALAAAMPKIMRATVDRMIDEILVAEAAKRDLVVVDDHEVDVAFETKQRELGFPNKVSFLASIAELGLDEARFRKMIENQLVEFKWLARAFAAERTRITPAAIDERLKRLRAQDPKTTEDRAKESLVNDAYETARQKQVGELRRAHYIEIRL